MASDTSLLEFIDAAKSRGAQDGFLAELLTRNGWPEDDVYRALGSHYERLTSLAIPVRRRSGAAAKDAFLYLLAFSTLGTWTISLGSLLFTLIDKWIADPLSPNRNGGSDYNIASSMASILVAFPIYVFVMRLILREVEAHPDKWESGVRKWLTYIALLIAAIVMICDLVTFLTYFLRGELTSRFVSKVAVVLAIAGSVFWYYLSSLRTRAVE